MTIESDQSTRATSPARWPLDFPPTWSGCPRKPLLSVLLDGFQARPNHVPLYFDDHFSITNAELQAGIEQFAGYLRQFVGAGDRVILAMGNRVEFVIASLAVLANRGVVIPVSPEMASHEAEFLAQDSESRIAIADPTSAPTLTALIGTPSPLERVIQIEGDEPHGFAGVAAGSDPLRLQDVEGDIHDMMDIGYTSGTTGLPKAIGGSHLETLRYLDVALRVRYRDADENTRILYPLQFHYGDPLTALYSAIYGGYSVIVMRKFSASRFWQVAKDLRATAILTIGSIPDMLLSRPEGPSDRDHAVRSAIALAIPPSRHAELERRFGFPWRETYGSSESGPAIAMPEDLGANYVGTGALGIPYPDVQARLVDEEGQELLGAASGELELAGQICFEGYVNNPEANAEILHDGWLRSGDIMCRDEDGMYYFLGRRKEIIRRSGINIAPAEVEAVLRLHADVVDAAVVPVPDEMMGEEVKAYVELMPGATFDPAALADFTADKLSRHKIPRYIELRVEPFPRTPTQRIPKSELKVDGAHRTDSAWDRSAAL